MVEQRDIMISRPTTEVGVERNGPAVVEVDVVDLTDRDCAAEALVTDEKLPRVSLVTNVEP